MGNISSKPYRLFFLQCHFLPANYHFQCSLHHKNIFFHIRHMGKRFVPHPCIELNIERLHVPHRVKRKQRVSPLSSVIAFSPSSPATVYSASFCLQKKDNGIFNPVVQVSLLFIWFNFNIFIVICSDWILTNISMDTKFFTAGITLTFLPVKVICNF